MPSPLSAGDVVVGLLTENTQRMLAQAIRLVRSIRWFGGELAAARIVCGGVGPLEPEARATLESFGVEIRTVSRFHPANPTANKLQLIAELLDAPEQLLLMLDCDTLVVRDPLPYLVPDVFQGKITPAPTVTDEVFERLFAHFGIPKPPRTHVTPFTGTPTIPYFNAGVLAIPTALARTLEPAWRQYNMALADRPELVAPCERHMHQASMALALAETKIPYRELPEAMNYQLNTVELTAPAGFVETDPVIIHYHQLATDDGFVMPCPYPAAQARIDAFHERLRAEGVVPHQPAKADDSPPVVILGMHRSGTSLVAQFVNALGVYAGRPEDLPMPDMFNPTGYWEHAEAVKIDTEILAEGELSDERRAFYLDRAKRVVDSLRGHGPFLLKDPRMALLFPLWREALGAPVCVITWRDPMAVARSLAKRDRRPLLASLASWEHHTRTLLRDSAGLSRLLVSYEALLADPLRVARELVDQLTAFGLTGIAAPSMERIDQIVKPDFNRSGAAVDDSLLDADQRALVADLRSGAVLESEVAPTSARTLRLLAEFDEAERREKELRTQVNDRGDLLDAVFASRSWQVGYRLTGLLRVGRGGGSVSAEDRWRELKGRK